MADELAAFNQRFMTTLEEVLREAGEAEVDHIKEDIGIEVQYTQGHVIRSNPDEPPRKETGKLQESIQATVSRPEPNVVELVISAGTEYAPLLEIGGIANFGEVKARPFMGPSMERWQSNGEYIVVEGLKEAK